MESIAASSPPQPSRSSPDSAAGCSPPHRAESVRVYSVQNSRLEFIAELGHIDGAHHAPEARMEPPAQSQGPGELVLAFCSNGTLLGVAYLSADAPRRDQSGDGDGDDDDEEEGKEQEVYEEKDKDKEDQCHDEDRDEDEDEDAYLSADARRPDQSGDGDGDGDDEDDDKEEGKEQDVDKDNDKDTEKNKDELEVQDENEDEDEVLDEDEDQVQDEDEDEVQDSDSDSDSTRTDTATDESSSSGSSVHKDSEDEANEEGDYDWEDWEGSDTERTKYEEPTYSLKIRVWPSRGHANIVLFDGIRWMCTQNYTLNMLSSTEAEIMVQKLAGVSQMDMELDNYLLASNAMLLRSEYEGVLSIIGKGAFCNVRLCTGGDGKDYAIKIIKSEYEDLREPREVAILSSLRNSHVVQLIQQMRLNELTSNEDLKAWTENKISVSYDECSSSDMSSLRDAASNDSREIGESRKYMQRFRYILILMELCEGTLGDYLSTQSRELDVEKSLKIFKGIVKGLHYVHGQNIIHRDLKPSNVFLGKDGKCKLGDFGQSRWQPRYNVSFKATPNLGTRFYAAPELEKGERISDKVDIYPLGVIYFELLNIFKTMVGKDKEFKKLKNDDASKIIWDGDLCLFRKMTASDPVKRPSVNDVLEHISQVLQKTEANGLHQPGQSEEVNVVKNQDSTPMEVADTRRGET